MAVILEMDGEMGDLLHILKGRLTKVIHLKSQPFLISRTTEVVFHHGSIVVDMMDPQEQLTYLGYIARS